MHCLCVMFPSLALQRRWNVSSVLRVCLRWFPVAFDVDTSCLPVQRGQDASDFDRDDVFSERFYPCMCHSHSCTNG